MKFRGSGITAPSVRLTADDHDLLREVKESIEEEGYQVQKESPSNKQTFRHLTRNLEIIKGYHKAGFSAAWKVSDKETSFSLGFIKVISRELVVARGSRKNVVAYREKDFYEKYPLAIIKLPQDVGHALIRPESLADKICELFGNVDIDYSECRQFSRRYFAIARDERSFRMGMPVPVIKAIGRFKGLLIEIRYGYLVYKSPKIITWNSIFRTIKVGLSLSEALSR